MGPFYGLQGILWSISEAFWVQAFDRLTLVAFLGSFRILLDACGGSQGSLGPFGSLLGFFSEPSGVLVGFVGVRSLIFEGILWSSGIH